MAINNSTTPQAHIPSDEIDLRELFGALWQGKWTIIIITALFSIGAVCYALFSQQWWSSKAKITPPQVQDIAAYQQQVKQFQPVFDVYQDDGTVLVSRELDELINTQVLFKRFIDAFNSSDNKRSFLDASEDFQSFKSKLDVDNAVSSDEQKDASRRLYAGWFNKITASAEDKRDNFSPYNVSFQSTTKESSFVLLNNYIQLITQQAHQEALNNLEVIIAAKRNELLQQKRILTSQAKNRLRVEIERSQYALDVAKAAGVERPIQTNNDKELFSIDLGTKGLAAKVSALESIKNLSVIEPRLQQIDAKLEMLEHLKVDRAIQFQTFRFVENVEQSLSRDKPKRALIAVLGTLLGGMLGVAIVLVRFAFRREED
ncbi:Wzz/FepE/Etk N-terminal domain-containing protein [Vibrio japonicus]|uniref:Wzz/FepE/Etk N-terminal domain-containing protein n=1 Tax=Vibrio japonicus TaxID=1824638 RepID=A0ABY5LHN6_9VIBR|nr:Wzz/FepE/Etk N-terminal domain-containing protein [Vibrio japonicus]UUM30456.1 Wzz/FepE/Etk N-terminal domain-containing protein [Vibrio japonicus]